MTPSEKAKELVEKYSYSIAGMCINDLATDRAAKQCAIICCDEILAIDIVWLNSNNPLIEDKSDSHEFWQQVKTEIQKL